MNGERTTRLLALEAAMTTGATDLHIQIAELQKTVATIQDMVLEHGRVLQAHSGLIADLQAQLRRREEP